MKINYHRELLGEDIVAKTCDEIKEKVATTYMAVDMKGHLSLHLLPLCNHLIPL